MQQRIAIALPSDLPPRRTLLPALCALWMLALALLLPGRVHAQAATETTSVAAAPSPALPAQAPAAVSVLHRKVATMRVPFLGIAPSERARHAQESIAELLDQGGPGEVTVQPQPQGVVLMIDGAMAFILVPGDEETIRGERFDAMAQRVAQSLTRAIAETREARDRGRLLRAAGRGAIATLVLALAVWAAWRIRRLLMRRAERLLAATPGTVQVGGVPLVHPSRVQTAAHWLVRALAWLVLAVLVYEWLVYVLTQFAYTRAWGEQLGDFLVGVLRQVGGGILRALPDLMVALFIFLLARLAVSLAKPMFDRVEQGGGAIGWLDRELAVPTRRIFTVAIWLFAIAMAYPYLPGAQSEAFKGISVLVGLMLTLGGSSLVGQGASGLILIYSRTIRVGEYVRINDQEGTVTELGTFTTKIRTGLGEEISMPNSLIMGSVTKNYSRTVRGPGYIVDTAVTIGYDTPWRQVEAMLVEAAHRTEGVLRSPEPQVFKTGLSDFYVEYRLVCQAIPSQPRPRAEVVQLLHSHVLDVFNEHGVQIMSPHYFNDPREAKVVPREQWWTPPAHRNEGMGAGAGPRS